MISRVLDEGRRVVADCLRCDKKMSGVKRAFDGCVIDHHRHDFKEVVNEFRDLNDRHIRDAVEALC